MLKKAITYVDLDGDTRTEDFWFNLTLPEVTELELSMPGSMTAHWNRLLETKDAGGMLKAYKDLITLAYGERSDDGRYFMKETESGYLLGRRFLQHPAYSALFLELLGEESGNEAFADFLRGILPQELIEGVPDNIRLPEKRETETVAGPPAERTIEQYSRDELLELSSDAFDELAGTDSKKWSRSVMEVAFQRRSQEKTLEASTEV